MTAHYLLGAAVDRFALRTERACSGLITALAEQAAETEEDPAP